MLCILLFKYNQVNFDIRMLSEFHQDEKETCMKHLYTLHMLFLKLQILLQIDLLLLH